MKPLLLDSDLLTFAATIGYVLINAPRKLQARKPRPGVLELEEVGPDKLTDKQRNFFEKHDRELAAMNYFPVCTFRTLNLERALLRRYTNPTDPAFCTVMAVEVKYHIRSAEEWAPSSMVLFRTDFPDGRSLTTRNMRRKTLLDALPSRVVQECPNTNDPAALKKKHDAKAAGMGLPRTGPQTAPQIFKDFQAEHMRFLEYQVQRGLYSRRAEGAYGLTSKAHWRAIRNHYNPFVQLRRVSPVRLSLAALLATGIPSITYLRFASGVSRATPDAQMLLFGSYAIAGVAIGLLIERNSFLWGFLLTFLGVHLCTGWWTSPTPFSMFAGITAFWVTRQVYRRRLMLAPNAQA